MERLATEAERASIKYKQVEYMSDKLERPFDGVISGVTEWGIYVEIIENQCEGMVALRDLEDDFYEYDEENYRIIGRSNGKIYTLGDKVKIEVVKADLQKKQLDFKLVTDTSEEDVNRIKSVNRKDRNSEYSGKQRSQRSKKQRNR
jgi:ribonuclease R